MSDHVFDTLARQAASGISRRGSLLALGALGLAAMAGPISADAKKNKNKKKKKDKNRNEEDNAAQQANEQCLAGLAACTAEEQRCADQVEQCSTYLTASCAGDPGCTYQAPCCSFLGACDMSGFVACLSSPPRRPA